MRILIIEDNVLFAQALERLLSRLRPGATVRVTHRLDEGEAAILQDGAPDVVLLDLGLPDAEGLGVLDRAVAAAPAPTSESSAPRTTNS